MRYCKLAYKNRLSFKKIAKCVLYEQQKNDYILKNTIFISIKLKIKLKLNTVYSLNFVNKLKNNKHLLKTHINIEKCNKSTLQLN